MSSRLYYAPLTPVDKQYLLVVAGRRWVAAGKRFLLSAVLPLIIILPLLFIVNLVILANLDEEKDIKGINIPEGVEDFSLLWFAVPVFVILVIINIIMLVRSMLPLYIDIWNGKKRQLIFTPRPYTLPGSGNYYIHTGLPVLRFIEVTYEQYMNIDYTRACFLEVTPQANVPLGFKTMDSIE